MGRERLLDLSQLEPPAPLQMAIHALDTLEEGEYLRMLVKRDPIYLYPLLLLQGFEHETHVMDQSMYEVFIWRKGDIDARDTLHNRRDTS